MSGYRDFFTFSLCKRISYVIYNQIAFKSIPVKREFIIKEIHDLNGIFISITKAC